MKLIINYTIVILVVLGMLSGFGAWLLAETQNRVDNGVTGVMLQLSLLVDSLKDTNVRLDRLIDLHMTHD